MLRFPESAGSMSLNMKISVRPAGFALLLCCGLLAGCATHVPGCNDPDFSLLSPNARCPDGDGVKFVAEYEEFEAQLEDWVEQQKAKGSIEEAGVYFRDLRAGPWFGINERAEFVPASLLKVPLMIAILHAADKNPLLLSQQLEMSGAYLGVNNVDDPASQSMQPGKPYTVDELLYKMIVYSDNASRDILQQAMDPLTPDGDSVSAVYKEIGMLAAEDKNTLTVKSYSSLFRILYNARYLSQTSSQKALDLLKSSVFVHGLVAGVPPGTVVAHKFGVRALDDEQTKQFHDCGIVYYPNHPYLLCIMTRAKDLEKGVLFLREVSHRVYTEVDDKMKANP